MIPYSSMNLSVIIPNYNGEEILSKNLPRVLSSVQDFVLGKVEIIISDDCSTDNSAGVIKKFIEDNKNSKVSIKLLTSSAIKNRGFSSNVDIAVGKASGDILLLFNTDVYPDKDFLSSLLTHFKDDNVFAVGCMDKSIEGKNVVLRGRGTGTWERGFLIHKKGEVDKNDTLWVSGGSGAFRKSIWEKMGGFNPLYNPFYWEDVDLSYRAQKAGYKVFFEPKSIVWHEHEKGSIKRKYTSSDVKRLAYRNQFIFVWTNVTDLDLVAKHILWFPYHLIKAFINRDFAFYLGLVKALFLVPKIYVSRYNNKKLFVKLDKEVVERFKK